MIKSKKLVEEYKKTIGKYTYEQRDCITSITKILLAHGGRHDLNGSNFYARNEIKNLRPLTDRSQLYDGCAVLKTILPGEPGYNLPPRYKNHVDQIDYNHIGIGTSNGEIYDSTRTADGRDGPGLSTAPINSRSWDRIGDFEDVDYSDQGAQSSVEDTVETPTSIGGYIVTAPSGDTVNLRAKMNTTSIVYEYVRIGATVEVLQRYASWSKVRTSAGNIGYIMNKFLAPVGDPLAETTHEENQNDHIQEEMPMEKIGEAIVRLPKGGSGKTVRLRSGPSKSANVRFEVPVGSVVSIFSQREGWWEIGYDGVTGWMMSSFLESSETMVSDKKAEVVTITLSKAAAEYLLEVLKGVL